MNQFNFLFSPMAQALGTTLLYSLWQAFIVFIFLRLILKLLPNATTKFKYHVFCLSYITVATWFIVTFLQQLSVKRSENILKEIAGQSVAKQIVFPYSNTQLPNVFSLSYLDKFLPWLTVFYFVGIAWFALKMMLSYFQTIRLRTEGLKEMDSAFMDQLWSLAHRMNIYKPVYAYVSVHVVSPVMIGFFRPMILLPIAAINNLSPQQMEAVLLHELAHIRRNDYLVNLLQTVIDILLFFNPFAYQISRGIRNEREKCCDEMALKSSDPYQYARALLKLEESGQSTHRLALGTNNKSSQLLHRIKNIMEMKNQHINLKQKLIALVIVISATVSIAWLTPRENNSIRPGDHNNYLKNASLITANQTNPVFLKQTFEAKEIKDTNYPKVIPPPPPPPSAPVATIAPLAPVPPAAPVAPVAPAAPKSRVAPKPPLPPLGKNRSAAIPVDTIPSVANYFKSPEFQKQIAAANKSADEMRKYFESDAWKKQQKSIQKSTEALNSYFKSPQWKHQIDTIQKNSVAINQYFSSDGWKKQQKEIQKNAETAASYFNSEAWKNQQKDIQKNAEKTQAYFNSDAWKKQQKEIQKSAEKLQEYFNSDQWKKQQIEIQKNAKKAEEYFKSDEWKKQQEDIKRSMDSLKPFFNKDA